MNRIFENRTTAAKELARLLETYKDSDGIVLALPRGGVPVGLEIARYLNLPLDVFVARKIGAPFNPEYGIGAIAEGNVTVWDEDAVRAVGATKKDLQDMVARESKELERRVATYRGLKPLEVKDKIVILVDDGLATGVTAAAAVHSLKLQKPKKIILAAPVCAQDTAQRLASEADELICVRFPENFMAVGQWYRSFEQLSDEDVIRLLK